MGLILSLLVGVQLLACASDQGWVLTQRSKELGDQYVYLNSKGFKCLNPRQGIGLVAKAPDWHLSFYNENTRRYFTLNSVAWRRKLETSAQSAANFSWQKGEGGQIAGLRATKFIVHKRSQKTGLAGSRKINKWTEADYWVADDIKVPAQLAEMLASAYGLPTLRSIPLRVTYKNTNGQMETILDTYQQRATPVPDSYLTFPTGYQPAKNEMEVMITEENERLIDDIAEDLNRKSVSSGKSSPMSASQLALPNNGLTLPNGQSISRDQINKYIDAVKQYKQNNR